jgi:C_GCAxxG_C_C family probable redox protein
MKKLNDLKSLLRKTLQKNDQTGSELRSWLPMLAKGQEEILLAAEKMEEALELLRDAREILEEPAALLTTEDIDRIAGNAAAMMTGVPETHYHCSEAFTIAVGEHFFGKVPNRIRRMTSGFAGGVGGTQQEICGALSGGILIIGAIYGRARANESDERIYKISALYRNNFIESFGSSVCHTIRDVGGYGSRAKYPCSVCVEKSVHVFFNTLISLEDGGIFNSFSA